MMRAVTYRRVSTDEQKEYGTELKGQMERCREYAAGLGYEIVAEIEDGGVSGKIPISQRPGGTELYHLVSTRAVDAVILTRADRLSRDEYGIESGLFHRLCDENDVTIHLVDEGGQLRSDMGGRLMLSLGDRMGGEERKKIAARMRDGRLNSVRSGNVMLCGHQPFGYKKIVTLEQDPITRKDKTVLHLEIDETQAKIIREIFRLYTLEGIGVKAIAKQFNERGIPSPRANRKPRPGKGTSNWWGSQVTCHLTCSRYIGEFVWAGYKVMRPDLAIVDRETFTKAAQRLLIAKQNSLRRTKHDYLFRSRLKCECGRVLVGKRLSANGKNGEVSYFRYRCCAPQSEVKNGCTSRGSLNATYLDASGWAKLVESLDPDVIRRSARDYVASQAAMLEPAKQRLKLVLVEQKDAERMAEEYLKLAARASAAHKLELLARYEDDAEKELVRAKRLAVEEGELRATLMQVAKYDEQEIERVLAEIDQRLKHGNPSFTQKRKFIEWANVQGKLDGEQVKFRMEIGITFEVEKQPPRQESPTSVTRSINDKSRAAINFRNALTIRPTDGDTPPAIFPLSTHRAIHPPRA